MGRVSMVGKRTFGIGKTLPGESCFSGTEKQDGCVCFYDELTLYTSEFAVPVFNNRLKRESGENPEQYPLL